jgi:hypothetical protein
MSISNHPSASPYNQPKDNDNRKNIYIGILAVALLGTWAYLLYSNNKAEGVLKQTQNQGIAYMSQRDSVQVLYSSTLDRLDSITINNNEIQGQLSERNSEISKIRTEIRTILNKKNASDAELSKARQLINQLNEKINGLENEVARLAGENMELNVSNKKLTAEKQGLEENLQATNVVKQNLEKTVDVGSTFTASNIQITPVNERKSGKEKETTTAKRVDKLVVTFDIQNRISKSGPADLYIMVTNPDGKTIADQTLGSGTLNTREDGSLDFTSKLAIQYEQGTTKRVELPLRLAEYKTGDYRIDVYHNGFKIGTAIRSLKKGGLFG